MKYLVGIFLLFGLFFYSCATYSLKSKDIISLKEDVSQLQIEDRELKQNHADLYAKVDSYSNLIDTLNASVLELQNKISFLSQIINDLETNLDQTKSGNTLIPSSLYQRAYADYLTGKFELAYSNFKSFIEKYPSAELAAQAQFYMGECLYSRNMYVEAIDEYKKVEQNYKKSNFVVTSRLKIALCYEKISERTSAVKIFTSIIRDFPKSQEAVTSKEKLKKFDHNAQEK
ncbi:MAG: tetratricopeptide repeat protein [Endomicrobium sp.]|jgi:tol-pal system protein YbgF|nr:tetratricopeptide repeat protein [Endomicrobium sp.]